MTDIDWSQIPHFTEDEFRCKCGCGRCDMAEEFMNRLRLVRSDLNAPIFVLSGYRCPDHNQAVSTTGRDGPHTTGLAADIYTQNMRQLIDEVVSWDFTGLGFKLHGAHAGRFIHVDLLEPRCWTYE